MRGLDNHRSAQAKRITHGDIAVEEVGFHFPSVDRKRRELHRIAIDMDMAIAGAWRRCEFWRPCHLHSIAHVLCTFCALIEANELIWMNREECQ